MEGGRPQGRENFWEVLMHYQGGKKKESSHYSTASYWAAPTSGGVVSGENELCVGCRSTTFFSLHIKHDRNGSQICLHYKYIHIYMYTH